MPPALTDAQEFGQIEALCRQAVLTMHGFTLLHVGLNSADADEARTKAEQFASMFSLPVTEFPGAYFAGSMMEIVKKPFLGAHGHIAVQANNADRAVAYFESRGYRFRKEGLVQDSRGILAVYFENEVGGFAIHLRRK